MEAPRPHASRRHIERWMALGDRVGWWCSWGAVQRLGDLGGRIGPGEVRVAWRAPGDATWSPTLEACEAAWCEGVLRSLPCADRARRPELLRVFGEWGGVEAAARFAGEPRQVRERILATVEAGIGRPARPELPPAEGVELAVEQLRRRGTGEELR